MLKRTPALAVVIAGLIAGMIIFLMEIPSRPLSSGQIIALYILSLFPSLGIALFFDPKAQDATQKLSQIDFYKEN